MITFLKKLIGDMKKIILMLMIAFVTTVTVNAQKEHQLKSFSIGVGVNSFNSNDINDNDKTSFVATIKYNWLHLDYTNSLREYPNEDNSVYWHGGNIGVNLDLTRKNANNNYVYLTPKLGYIVCDEIIANTVYSRKAETNGGFEITLCSDDACLSMGVGTVQRLYFTFGVTLDAFK